MPVLKLIPIHRVSTAMQAGEDGEGLDRQRDATRRIIADRGAVALAPVDITDVSGSDVHQTSEWRDEILPLLSDSNTHIAVDSIDRLIRADGFNFSVMQDMLKTSTRIYTPGQIHDLSDPADGFMAGLYALIGGRDKAEIQRRMMAGREAARKRGEWPMRLGLLPAGITYDRPTKTWGYDDPQAEVVKRVFSDYVTEGRTLRAIARGMGKPHQSLRRWLQNHIYMGIVHWDTKAGAKVPTKNGKQARRKRIKRAPHEVIEVRVFGPGCALPQLVPTDMWEAAQRRLLDNTERQNKARIKSQPHTWPAGFLLSAHAPRRVPIGDGFFRFGLNERNRHSIQSNGARGGTHRYFCYCGRKETGLHRCEFRSAHSGPMLETLDAYMLAMTTEPWFLEAVQESASRPQAGDPAVQRKSLQAKLNSYDKRESRLTRLYLDGRIGDSAHDGEQDKIRGEREGVKRALAGLVTPPLMPTSQDLDTLAKTWAWDPSWGHEKKREWLSKYVVSIHISNAGVEQVIVRIPAGSGSMPVFGSGYRLDWINPVLSSRRSSRKPKAITD
jgi:DNA invertase Pin-like site-specific DNA recombinase